jgi:ABC-type nickel/cobalt efflux system permease component RcnA
MLSPRVLTWLTRAAAVILIAGALWGIWIAAGRDQLARHRPDPTPAASSTVR